MYPFQIDTPLTLFYCILNSTAVTCYQIAFVAIRVDFFLLKLILDIQRRIFLINQYDNIYIIISLGL